MPVNSENVIEVYDVSYTYDGNPVLENISFSVKNGEYLGIIGPNGGGKTTLLKILLGLLTPTIGEVKLFGQKVAKFSKKHLIGYVPQRVSLVGQMPATV